MACVCVGCFSLFLSFFVLKWLVVGKEKERKIQMFLFLSKDQPKGRRPSDKWSRQTDEKKNKRLKWSKRVHFDRHREKNGSSMSDAKRSAFYFFFGVFSITVYLVKSVWMSLYSGGRYLAWERNRQQSLFPNWSGRVTSHRLDGGRFLDGTRPVGFCHRWRDSNRWKKRQNTIHLGGSKLIDRLSRPNSLTAFVPISIHFPDFSRVKRRRR